MKTAVTLPDNIIKRADNLAKKRKISRNKLFAEAIESYLDEYDDDEITRKLNEFYEKNPATIDSAIMKMAALSLPKDEW
jgi:metal-responsive CopG/Arc/MetJ family transcriptional regulator